ncbi:MAG: hypothetical protein CM15mP25_4160 [Gammaproteobacteria bacterium]|nr:MAG: hypothetical protein CM15mP25_4160 [Gammaproteobacteria bacterium]
MPGWIPTAVPVSWCRRPQICSLQITYQTGIVTVPKPAASQLRQIEFLPLSGDRVLVILVINEREVQNRIIQMQRPMDESSLRRRLS